MVGCSGEVSRGRGSGGRTAGGVRMNGAGHRGGDDKKTVVGKQTRARHPESICHRNYSTGEPKGEGGKPDRQKKRILARAWENPFWVISGPHKKRKEPNGEGDRGAHATVPRGAHTACGGHRMVGTWRPEEGGKGGTRRGG